MKKLTYSIGVLVFALAALAAPSLATSPALVCSSELVSDRPYFGANPCTPPKNGLLVQAEYFQNASTVGGSQLAAYPLVRIRYGVSDHLELFVDPASAYAKNGLNGKGIYGWRETGFGAKYSLATNKYSSYSITLNNAPQLDETAALPTQPSFQTTLASRFKTGPRSNVGFSVALLHYYPSEKKVDNMSVFVETLAYTRLLSSSTRGTVHVASFSNVTPTSRAQSRIGIALQHDTSKSISFDVGIGSTFNDTGNTKAHYLEAGVLYRTF